MRYSKSHYRADSGGRKSLRRVCFNFQCPGKWTEENPAPHSSLMKVTWQGHVAILKPVNQKAAMSSLRVPGLCNPLNPYLVGLVGTRRHGITH